ncbi:hypothetical protein C8Q76DRAFT_829910 [Earliella scabrosa]|nr:hypothetical protein C8Q76DRAFT_829910 [Earliella scabrosa]
MYPIRTLEDVTFTATGSISRAVLSYDNLLHAKHAWPHLRTVTAQWANPKSRAQIPPFEWPSLPAVVEFAFGMPSLELLDIEVADVSLEEVDAIYTALGRLRQITLARGASRAHLGVKDARRLGGALHELFPRLGPRMLRERLAEEMDTDFVRLLQRLHELVARARHAARSRYVRVDSDSRDISASDDFFNSWKRNPHVPSLAWLYLIRDALVDAPQDVRDAVEESSLYALPELLVAATQRGRDRRLPAVTKAPSSSCRLFLYPTEDSSSPSSTSRSGKFSSACQSISSCSVGRRTGPGPRYTLNDVSDTQFRDFVRFLLDIPYRTSRLQEYRDNASTSNSSGMRRI